MNQPQNSSEKTARSVPKANTVTRLLAPVTVVRPDEAVSALLLMLTIFLILAAYYLIKPVREGLILEIPNGPVLKSYASAATALLFLVVVPLYAALTARMARNRLVISVTLFFCSNLVIFWFWGSFESTRGSLAVPFYLWIGVFNMMVIAQFWAFANDLCTEEQGKRLFAMIGIGASVGGAVGSKIAAWLLTLMDVYQMLLIGAATLSVTAILTQIVHVREVARRASAEEENALSKSQNEATDTARTDSPSSAPPRNEGSFRLVFGDRYLRLLAAFHFIFTFVNTNGEYILGKVVADAAPLGDALLDGMARKEWIAHVYADFFFYVGITGILIQTLLVSRLIRLGGLRLGILTLPLIALGGAAVVVFTPVLAIVRIAKIFENATDYSLNNTVRHMLWLVTSRSMKYNAKQATDTFFVRMGDVASALLVGVGTAAFSLPVQGFAAVNIVLIFVWIFLALAIIRENRKRSTELST
jgi:AAA family ATP:ADP antiporter